MYSTGLIRDSSAMVKMVLNLSGQSQQRYPLAFDYQATTPCSEEVIDAMKPYWNECWGNASNRQNRLGLLASAAVGLAREQLGSNLNIKPESLIFTSGATEANNLALLGHARAKAREIGRPGHLITVTTEHHAVLDPMRALRREGFRLSEINPNADGLISPVDLINAFKDDTFMVSVMIANNEIGVIQPIADLARTCKQRGITFHTDAAQAFGHLPIDISELGVDLLSLSGHKLYGPKGIGALVMRSDLPMLPLYWGGGQEMGLRPGTIPVPLVVGFAKAAEIAMRDLVKRSEKLTFLRNRLWEELNQLLPDLILNGSLEQRLPHNLNFTVPSVLGSRLHRSLRPIVGLSSGSACSNGRPSHVLRALGRSSTQAEASLRLSIGWHTTEDDIKLAVKAIAKVVNDLRNW